MPTSRLSDPHVEFTQDHILVSLDRWTKLATVSGSFAIPYSTVRDATVETPTVVDELQRGYTMHGKLLRPALVRVAMPAEKWER